MARDKPKTLLAGRYELLEVSGKGGMAVVWRALRHDRRGGTKVVAIKRMLVDISRDPSTVALFIEEARVGAQLAHPNIVRVIDFGTDEYGSYYLVLEWVDGLDLLEYMRSFHQTGVHVPWQAVAAIALQALRGLVGAHERRDKDGNVRPVIHRDMSPSNILISTDGVVKIADFGLARAMDRMTMTLPNIIKGKLAYTAPEVAAGRKATEQSDLFSLGITLWECLAARRIFPGETNVDVFKAIQAWKFPSLEKLRPDVPQGMILAIGRAMERDPARRFQVAREMAAVFAGVMRDARPALDLAGLGASVNAARERLVALDQDIPVTVTEEPSAVSEISLDVPVDFASSPSIARIGSRRIVADQPAAEDDTTPTERRVPEPLLDDRRARSSGKPTSSH